MPLRASLSPYRCFTFVIDQVAAASRNSLQEMHERIELNVKRRYIRDQVQLLQQNTLSSLATGQTSSSMSKGVLSASDNDAVAGGVGSPSNTESKVAADITIVGQRIRFRYGGGALTKWRVAVVASYSSSRKAFLLQFADVGTSINTIEAYQHRSEWVRPLLLTCLCSRGGHFVRE